MKIGKKGYTLIELIIVIAIVAALGVAGTFGLQKVIKSNQASTYRADLKEIASSTKTYLAVARKKDSSSLTTIKLEEIVNAGYVDDDFYDKTNGLTCQKFSKDTVISYKTVDGMRKIFIGNCDIDDISNCDIKEEC